MLVESSSKDVKRSKEVVCSLLLFCYLFADSCFGFLHLRQGRVQIVVPAHIVVKQAAVVLGHVQCAMTHQLLQSKGIAATVHQIFLCKSVSVFVNGGSLDSSVVVESSDCVAQRILCQLPTIHIAEQIILWRTFSDSHILP